MVWKMTTNKWPSDYPQNIIVPPEDAFDLNHRLYRAVLNDPPESADFVASYKDPGQMHLGRKESVRNNPKFYATSFFDTFDSLSAMMKESPQLFSNKKIAEGDVTSHHGKGLNGSRHNPHHLSVWLYDGVFPNGFKIL